MIGIPIIFLLLIFYRPVQSQCTPLVEEEVTVWPVDWDCEETPNFCDWSGILCVDGVNISEMLFFVILFIIFILIIESYPPQKFRDLLQSILQILLF